MKIHVSKYCFAILDLLKQISKDAMLALVCLTPFLCGSLFRFGIPALELLLMKTFGFSKLLMPYALLFDLFLAILTPTMYCFVAAMVLLEEIDNKIAGYMAVTPLGIKGYLASRLVFPAAAALLVSIIALNLFSLSNLSMLTIIAISFLASLNGLIVSLMVVAISANKVEGMAVTKMSGLLMLGVVIPFFVKENVQYLGGFMPSFWLARSVQNDSFLAYIMSAFTALLWIGLLWKKFEQKIRA